MTSADLDDFVALLEANPSSFERLLAVIADRLAEMIAEREGAPTAALVDAQAVADALGVSRGYVYEHADELGAVRNGSGPRPRLRFDLAKARAAWTSRCMSERSQPAQVPVSAGVRRRRRARRTGTSARLLPVHGEEAA